MPKTLDPYMDQETHEKTGVCWLGNQFYVLRVGSHNVHVKTNTPGLPLLPHSDRPFQRLSGGTHDVLNGTHWGGITLDDIVISSYSGYLNNGNRNGYNITMDDSQGAVDQLMFARGVQTPGFFSLPVCTNLWTTIMQIAKGSRTSEHYPCGVEVE